MKLVGACAEDIGQLEMKDAITSALKNQGEVCAFAIVKSKPLRPKTFS